MVPVRFVGQALGATVNWNPSAKTVLVADEENTVVFAVGSDEMTVNGRTTPIDTAAVIQDNRTMLPLRAVAESIGATVIYADGTITISRKAPSEIATVVNYQELKRTVLKGFYYYIGQKLFYAGRTCTKAGNRTPCCFRWQRQ